jgi:hypothetical protein
MRNERANLRIKRWTEDISIAGCACLPRPRSGPGSVRQGIRSAEWKKQDKELGNGGKENLGRAGQ